MSELNRIRINIKSNRRPQVDKDSRSRSPHKDLSSLKSNTYRSRSEDKTSISSSNIEKNSLVVEPFKSKTGGNESKEGLGDQEGRGRTRDREDVKEIDDESEMIGLMGFGGFSSTKGKHVKSTKGGGFKQEKTSDYRQYMNRTKGFNRALSPNGKR